MVGAMISNSESLRKRFSSAFTESLLSLGCALPRLRCASSRNARTKYFKMSGNFNWTRTITEMAEWCQTEHGSRAVFPLIPREDGPQDRMRTRQSGPRLGLNSDVSAFYDWIGFNRRLLYSFTGKGN